ncbi:2'-5'-oligoadenylate synthase 1-like [Gracilinanus agilis]|uniref:2'-5'-oligoadenylate synthase 1-like n=1 Tax=Gracilinanus agilis TaxID=191870 RepID=UPI001CFF2CFA|nr:2'-5'-oligoadenylate synthase 1-like [Gracilinanus agilis]
MQSRLWNTQAKDLDKYIEEHLLPDTTFRTEIRCAIDIICSFLKERCFQGLGKSVQVTKVVKGGSSGKGTALKGCSDADLVVFLSNLKSYRDQIDRRSEFIEEIKKQMEACQHEQGQKFEVKFEVYSSRTNPRALRFSLKSTKISQWVDFDVLPAFDVLGQLTTGFRKPDPQVYINLIRESLEPGEFSTCFTELQKQFLSQSCTKLKSLIRLVKHWYKMSILFSAAKGLFLEWTSNHAIPPAAHSKTSAIPDYF